MFKSYARFATLAVIIGASAMATNAQTVRLKDSDADKIARLLPLSTQGVQVALKAGEGVISDFNQTTALYEDLRSGKRSALDEIHRLVPDMPVLAGARYQKECSAQMSLRGSLTAVFSLPAESDASLVQRTLKFYKAHGYQVTTGGMSKSSIAMMTFKEDEWDHHPSLSATQHFGGETQSQQQEARKFDPACASLVGAPALTLNIDGVSNEGAMNASASRATAAGQNLNGAVAREGWTNEQYQDVLLAVMQADRDAKNENVEEEIEAFMQLPDFHDATVLRKENLAWYRRNRSKIGPALEDYLKHLDMAR